MSCHCRSITALTSPPNTGARSSQGDPSDRWMRQPGCLTGPMAVGGMAGASRYLRVLLNKNAKGHHPRLLLAPLPSGLRQVGSSSPRPCLVLDALRRNIDDTIVRGLGETRKETKKLDCCQNNIFRSNMFCQRGSELTAAASSTSGRISGSGTCRGGIIQLTAAASLTSGRISGSGTCRGESFNGGWRTTGSAPHTPPCRA